MSRLKKKHLKALGFHTTVVKGEFIYQGTVKVVLTHDKDTPIISIREQGTDCFFPGAYTLKDLQQLLFFIYDEKEYTKRFGGCLPVKIISENKEG